MHTQVWEVGSSYLPERAVWLDIETRKVQAPEAWPYRLRWQPFMIATCRTLPTGKLRLHVVAGDEFSLIDWARNNFDGCEMRYAATREFDEMVLRGRFTNARRAHNPTDGHWPNLNFATVNGHIEWVNIRKQIKAANLGATIDSRGPDCASKEVPVLWATNTPRNEHIVSVHCARDAVELVLTDPDVALGNHLRSELNEVMRNGWSFQDIQS